MKQEDIQKLVEKAERMDGIDEFNPKKHEAPITVPASKLVELIEVKNSLTKLVKDLFIGNLKE